MKVHKLLLKKKSLDSSIPVVWLVLQILEQIDMRDSMMCLIRCLHPYLDKTSLNLIILIALILQFVIASVANHKTFQSTTNLEDCGKICNFLKNNKYKCH